METRFITRNYDFSEAFWNWLEKNRPEAYLLLKEKNVTSGTLTAVLDEYFRPGRFRLTLTGMNYVLCDDFDRQVDSEDACMVLEKHPDLMNEPISCKKNAQEFLDAEWLSRQCKRSIYVPVKVVGREVFSVRLELPDNSIEVLDEDWLAVNGVKLC